MSQNPTETSVLVSLRELVALESERLEEEERERREALAREEEARRLAVEAERAAEQARIEAEEATRRERTRAAAEQAARLDAIRRGEIEKARIVAEATAQRELVEAQHHHDREMARLAASRSKQRMKLSALVLGGVLLLGGGAAVAFSGVFGAEDDDRQAHIDELVSQNQKILRERLESLDGFRARLDQQHDALASVPSALKKASTDVAQSRGALENDRLDDAGLDRYQKALSAMAGELAVAHRSERLAELQSMHAALVERVDGIKRPSKALEGAAKKASAARRTATDSIDDAALNNFAKSIDKLALALADEKGGTPGTRGVYAGKATSTDKAGTTEPKGPSCDPHDPLCGDLPGITP